MKQLIKGEAGTTLIELTVAIVLFAMIIGTAYYVLDTGNTMYTFSKDGFEAQDQGRLVLARITKYARQGEPLNVPGYPTVKAHAGGMYFDQKLDVNTDLVPEIVRFELLPDAEYGGVVNHVVMHVDYRESGKYNYQSIGDTKAAYDSTYPSGGDSGWDETIEVANKVVSKPTGSGYPAQTVTTDPRADKRVFTFYGNDMETPLDSVSNPVWMNSVRGVKIIVLTDVRPAQIPSPFQVETNVNLRNLMRE